MIPIPDAIPTAGGLVPYNRPQANRTYDRTKRDPQSKRFYDSRAWRTLRRSILSAAPLCHDCHKRNRIVLAEHVHHIAPLRTAPELALENSNLVPLCSSCHTARHNREGP